MGRSSGAGVFSGCLCTLLLFCSATPAFSAKATLAWQANSETDLAGYCAYVNNGNPALPLTRYGCTFLGELSDPKNPTYQLVGLTQGDHCFAVTAFNTRGDESGYSNVVCAPIFESAMPWLKKLLLEE